MGRIFSSAILLLLVVGCKKAPPEHVAPTKRQLFNSACKTYNRISAGASTKGICQDRSDATKVGTFTHPTYKVSEVSGMVIVDSATVGDRIYYINDSGDGPYLYFSDLDGTNLNRINITGYSMRDFEGITRGPCASDQLASDCLIISDQGNNNHTNVAINLVFMDLADVEAATGVGSLVGSALTDGIDVAPRKIASLSYSASFQTNEIDSFTFADKYPDVEAIAYNSRNHNIYMTTKSLADTNSNYYKTRLIKITSFPNSSNSFVLSYSSEINLPNFYLNEVCSSLDFNPNTFNPISIKKYIPSHFDPYNPISKIVVTDMAFSEDGNKLYFLTYNQVWEIAFTAADTTDPTSLVDNGNYSNNTKTVVLGEDYLSVPLVILPQMESFALIPGTDDFLYSTEIYHGTNLPDIYRVDCND